MKILFITRDIKSGIGTTVKNLIWQFETYPEVKKITVIAPETFEPVSDKVNFIIAKDTFKFAPFGGKYFFTKEPYFAYKASQLLLKAVQKESYDIVHFHSNILKYKFLKKKAAIISTFQVSHEALQNLNTPIISTFHTSQWAMFSKSSLISMKYHFGKYLHLLFVPLDSLRIKFSDIVTFVSKYTMDEMMGNSIENKEKFVYVPNGIDLEQYKPVVIDRAAFLKENFDVDISNRKMVITITRLEAGKGIFTLANALKDEKDVVTVYLGEGPEQTTLASYENIKCLGYISDPEVKNKLLNCADLFVLASQYENFPSVIVEAMAAGKPIVSTSVGMVPEILDNNESVLTTPGDVNEMNEKIMNILNNPIKLEAEGRRNLDYVKENLPWSKIARIYYNLYEKLIQNYAAKA